MSQYWIIVAILLPIIGGVFIPVLPFVRKSQMFFYIEAFVLLTSGIVWALIMGGTTEVFHVVHFVHELSISFKIETAPLANTSAL